MGGSQDDEHPRDRSPLGSLTDVEGEGSEADAEDAGLLPKDGQRLQHATAGATAVLTGAPRPDTGHDRHVSSLGGLRPAEPQKQKPVGWTDLPRKPQLVVITLTRLSEPLVQTSLQAYMFYQLKWFDPSLSDAVIASQAGVLHASFTAAQFLTAMFWGRAADSSMFGRKTVILIGLSGTAISCLGFGFSTSFWQALAFRSLGGITNGNVGVLRTMISETIYEKKYQSRAFLLLPMTFNVGVIVGPSIGGMLADPAGSYPGLFGHVALFKRFPYALPNLVSALFLASAFLAAWLCLEETLEFRRDQPDVGLQIGARIASALRRCFSWRKPAVAYTPLASRDTSVDVEMLFPAAPTQRQHSRNVSSVSASTTNSKTSDPRRRRWVKKLPLRLAFTRNVTLTFAAQFLLAFHVGTFNSMWFVFLSTPTSTQPHHLPFVFTGGLGLPPRSVGMAMSILGVIGISLQLLLYPTISARLGTVRSWRIFLMCFPVAYFLVPYLSLVPSDSPPPSPKSGIAVWISIACVLFVQVLARTMVLPAQTILVNNASPHGSVLGFIHGVGQSVSSGARTIGPILCGYLFGLGLERGVVGAVWWGLSCVAVLGWVVSWAVREGNGHEIWLEGDEEDEAEAGGERAAGESRA